MFPPTECAAWSARAESAEHPSASALTGRNPQIGIFDAEPPVNELNLTRFCFCAHLLYHHPVQTPRGIENGTLSRGCYWCASIPCARYTPIARLLFTGLAPRLLYSLGQQKSLASVVTLYIPSGW
jgi:hypothetical protein